MLAIKPIWDKSAKKYVIDQHDLEQYHGGIPAGALVNSGYYLWGTSIGMRGDCWPTNDEYKFAIGDLIATDRPKLNRKAKAAMVEWLLNRLGSEIRVNQSDDGTFFTVPL